MKKILFAIVFSAGMAIQAGVAPSYTVPDPSSDNSAAHHPGQQKYLSGSLVNTNAKLEATPLELVYSPVFTNAVATNVLADLHDGLESHNRRRMLSAFDADKMDGYSSFADKIDSYFEKYVGFQADFRVMQITTLGSRGVAWVDFDLIQIARTYATVPIRRRSQVRFEMELGQRGWKIVEFRPKEFFQ